MPNVNAVLNEQIRRLARREITANTRTIKRATAHYRRDIAALKRQMAQVVKLVSALQKHAPSQAPLPSAEAVQGARLRIDGLKAHRARLGLSAKDYGKLMGVSALTIYNWEGGKSKPRPGQLPRRPLLPYTEPCVVTLATNLFCPGGILNTALACLSALGDKFRFESTDEGRGYRVGFSQGVLTEPFVFLEEAPTSHTSIIWSPDSSVFGQFEIDSNLFRQQVVKTMRASGTTLEISFQPQSR